MLVHSILHCDQSHYATQHKTYVYSSAEINTPDIRIFVRFALFEHNLCYPTIRLQPCGFALCIVCLTIWRWEAHNWWNIFSYQYLCSAHTIIVLKIHISTNYSTIRSFDMWIFEYTKVVFISALVYSSLYSSMRLCQLMSGRNAITKAFEPPYVHIPNCTSVDFVMFCYLQRSAIAVMFVWWEDPTIEQAEWSCVTREYGVHWLTTRGELVMLKWSAGCWDSSLNVSRQLQ